MTSDEIDALITNRLVTFHGAMIRRGQIKPAAEELPSSLVVAGSFEVSPDVGFLSQAHGTSAGR
jgi:hypothetical protein